MFKFYASRKKQGVVAVSGNLVPITLSTGGGHMLIGEPLPFIKNYIDKLDEAIKTYCPGNELSRIQRCWLSFCVTAIIVTNSVCWSRFQKVGIGQYGIGALSWMFRKSSIPWEFLLQMSVAAILQQYGITEGCIGIDDTDEKRSKSPERFLMFIKSNTNPVADMSWVRASCFGS
jgi:hypothetical protein